MGVLYYKIATFIIFLLYCLHYIILIFTFAVLLFREIIT